MKSHPVNLYYLNLIRNRSDLCKQTEILKLIILKIGEE